MRNKPNLLLTNHRDVQFELCFKYRLENGYRLTDMSQADSKDFQRFLDKVSGMTVQQVDNKYIRKPDKNDTYQGLQVIHYAVTDSFRIHVVLEDGFFKIIRLDPNHRFHG